MRMGTGHPLRDCKDTKIITPPQTKSKSHGPQQLTCHSQRNPKKSSNNSPCRWIVSYTCCNIVLLTLSTIPVDLKRTLQHIIFRLSVLLLILFSANTILAQRLTPNQTSTIRNIIIQHLGKEANLRVLENGKAAFLPIGKDTFFNIHGLRYVFQLKSDSAIRLDKSIYHGSNFYRYLFEHDGKMMALGGYGMFVTNNNLEAFNAEAHEWYLVKTYGDVPKSIKGSGLRFGHFIYVLNNCIDGNNLNENRMDDYFYRLDLRNMEWSRFKEFRPEHRECVINDFFYLKDFVIAKGTNHSFIYNLKTQEYIYSDNDALGLKQFTGYNTNIHENKLDAWILDSLQTVIKDPQRDIDALWRENIKLAQPLILEPSIIQQYPQRFYGFFIGLICLLSGLIWFRKHKQNKANDSSLHPLVQKMLQHSESSLTQEQLDQLLEIAHMEGESKKTKRHRLLAMIEGQYPGLIERQKDSSDKRRFLYFIHKKEE